MMHPSIQLSVLFICGIAYSVDGRSCFGGKKCPSGWVGTGTSCYMFSATKRTWEDAKAECVKHEAILAEVNSVSENDFLMNKAREHGSSVWIGATDTCTEGKFEWDASGDSAGISKWQNNEPNDVGGNEDCVELRKGFNYKWNDMPCTYKLGYVCEKNMVPSV